MKHLLLLGFLFLVISKAHAQQFGISLADQKFGKWIEHVEVGELVDLRYDKTNIGWVRKGMSNEMVQANLAGNLKDQISNLVNASTTPVATVLPVIVKVNKLAISEYLYGDREYASAEVALEFLVQESYGSENYYQILNTGSVVQTSSMTDVTGRHAENLVNALSICFRQLDSVVARKEYRNRLPVTDAYLQVNSYYRIDPKTIPVLQAPNPARGVYRNFYEFKNNAPGLTNEVSLDKNGNFIYNATGKKVADIWGFSDGVTAYIRFGDFRNYFPLGKKADHFTFSGKVSAADPGSVIMGGLLGGMAGAALAGALTEKTQLVEFAVNPITGKVGPANAFGPAADLAKTAKVILFRKNNNEAAETVSLFVNDSLYARLPPNTTTELTFNVPVSELEFCLKANDRTCLKITPVLDRTLYLECSLPGKTTSKPILKQVAQKEADYYLKIIKHNQQKDK